MKNKKIFSLLLAMTLIVCSLMPVYADEVEPWVPDPVIDEYNNVDDYSVQFYYDTSAAAFKVKVDVDGFYGVTTSIHVHVQVDKMNFFAIYRPYASADETYNTWSISETYSFPAATSNTQYRAIVTITVSGSGGTDDEIQTYDIATAN